MERVNLANYRTRKKTEKNAARDRVPFCRRNSNLFAININGTPERKRERDNAADMYQKIDCDSVIISSTVTLDKT